VLVISQQSTVAFGSTGMTLYLMYGSKLNHQDYCYLKKMRSRKQSTLHSLSAMD